MLFGIAERSDRGYFITQIYAQGGRVVGAYRKRHLGDGEDGFTPGERPLVPPRRHALRCRHLRRGCRRLPVLGAGGGRRPGRVLLRRAGLTGRRTDEAGLRAGFESWEGCGLADAVRHARRWGVSVALTTQAGSTRDEEFPGLAALVPPDGEVVARLPDWHPATLVVET